MPRNNWRPYYLSLKRISLEAMQLHMDMSHWTYLETKLPADIVRHCIQPLLVPNAKRLRKKWQKVMRAIRRVEQSRIHVNYRYGARCRGCEVRRIVEHIESRRKHPLPGWMNPLVPMQAKRKKEREKEDVKILFERTWREVVGDISKEKLEENFALFLSSGGPFGRPFSLDINIFPRGYTT